MKEFEDYSNDDTFPLTQDQTLTPVFRKFDDNFLTRIGVFIAEFIYPPVLIEDVVGKHKVQLKINITPFLTGVLILLSILLGIMCGIRWFVLYRERKRLNQIPLYIRSLEFNDDEQELRLARCALDQEPEELAAPNLAIAENIAMNETYELVIDGDNSVKCAMKITCDSEITPHNFVGNKIVPCEADRVVRQRFIRKQVTTNTEAIARKPTVCKPIIPEPVTCKTKY